ncbi:MAG: hypothetical protein IID54_00490, partial [Proteobacteria bacterium]|nr:hypothetical protein [Pseudomonadota bacterium]
MAPSLIAVTPAAIGCFTAQPDKTGTIFATLNVHNYFSTLLVANSEIGLIAVRQLPFGAMTVAQAYADAFGIGLVEASDVLNRRPRLPPAAAVHGELPAALEHKTASFAALAPNLRMLSNEILATLDYFHFERMGGLPAALSLSFSGPSIAGLDEWLSDALALRVELVQMTPAHLPALLEKAPHFNLLEGSRTGLLKIGNRPFEFMDGRFKPIKGSDPKMRANAKAGISLHSLGNLTIPPEIAKLLSSYGRRYAVPAASCAAFALVTFLNIAFLTSPAKNTLAAHTADYSSAAEQSLQRVAVAKVEASGEVAGDVGQPLWAEHLVSVSQALLPEMRLERMEMNPTGPTLDAAVTLSLFGILPTQSPDNLKLIASFMDRLSEDETFMRKFTAVNFSGADNTNGNTPASMSFQVAATETGAE